MPESIDGGEKGDLLDEADMSTADMKNKLAVLEIEAKTLANILRPSIITFVRRVLKPFNESRSIMLGDDEGHTAAFYPSIVVEPDIEATEIVDGVLHLKNWKAKLTNSLDERENQLFAVRIFEYLQSAGFDVSGFLGGPFDMKIPLKDFEDMLSGDDVVCVGINSIRERLLA